MKYFIVLLILSVLAYQAACTKTPVEAAVPTRAVTACRCAAEEPKAPVCATDGVTYESECAMRCEATEQRKELKVAHTGRCGAPKP